MNRILQVFERPRVLLPVIHACDEKQVTDQALLAKKCGADGVFVINQGGLDVAEVLDVAALLTTQIPGWFVGVNLLGVDPVDALAPLSKRPWVRGLWSDDADSGAWERRRVFWSSGPECERLFFGGVAFKGQRSIHPDHYGAVAKGAAVRGVDVVTTSGPQTGTPPEVSKVAVMREALGDHALALASGVTPENVGLFLPFVDAFLVATGIERDFGEFDPARLSDLAATIHGWSPAPC